jgi:hypothetical protein
MVLSGFEQIRLNAAYELIDSIHPASFKPILTVIPLLILLFRYEKSLVEKSVFNHAREHETIFVSLEDMKYISLLISRMEDGKLFARGIIYGMETNIIGYIKESNCN